MSDHLIASNGLIHPKLVGEMRYLDSRDDEQARGITMKSSSISLLYVPGAAYRPEGPRSCSEEEKAAKGYLMNLIDSPGHVDFCSEVSTAARLSDGALVLVDAVEGVCIQTHAVLRQAWEEKVQLCLVVNKIDRLILELQLQPHEAYDRIKGIITQVNMIVSAFESESFMSEADAVLAHENIKANADAGTQQGEVDLEDKEDHFQPQLGNVAFASAHDGWAFRITQLAKQYADKLGCNAAGLEQALWGDFAFQAKTKRIIKIKPDQTHKHKPLFVQLALEPLWKLYEVCNPGTDVKAILSKAVKSLGLTQAVLSMAVEHLPDPASAAPGRLARLLPPQQLHLKGVQLPKDLQQALDSAEHGVESCNTSPEAPCVVYVSKMVAVPAAALPRQEGRPPPQDPSQEVFLAFGRVFSGVLKDGQSVHVLSAAYNPAQPHLQRQIHQVDGLYLMMGRGLDRLQQVPAGNVIAIGGLGTAILKSATITSSPACRPLAPMLFQAAPIVRVAVEAALPSELPRLVEGLRLLNRADPFLEVTLQDKGEYILGAAGEVHLETVIKDLKERFARIQLQVSPPLVAFRESVFLQSESPEAIVKPPKVIEATTANGVCTMRIKAVALPGPVATALDENADLIRMTLSATNSSPNQERTDASTTPLSEPSADASVNGDAEVIDPDQQTYSINEGRSPVQDAESSFETDADAVHLSAGDEVLSVQLPASDTSSSAQLPASKESSSAAAEVSPAAAENSSSSQDHSYSVAEAVSNADEKLASQGGSGDSSHGVQHPAEAVSGKNGANGRAVGTSDNGDATSSMEEGGSLTSGKIGILKQRLIAAAKEAKAGSPELLKRIWSLGPKRTGPNFLLSSETTSASLFSGPDAAVVRLSAKQEKKSASHPAQADLGGPGGPQVEDPALRPSELAEADAHSELSARAGTSQVTLRLGRSEASATLGLAPQSDTTRPDSMGPGWDRIKHSVESGIMHGYQLATAAGPLCDEPMWGIAFEVEARLNVPEGEDNPGNVNLAEEVYGPFSGQVTSTARQAFRRAVLEGGPRLVEAMFLCQVSTASEALSGVYAVLGRRRARVVREEMREGSDLFSIHAYLPAQASFGFANDMRRQSSGAASASLMLSHWERLQIDPFFMPVTEEEREEFGEEGQGVGTANLARTMIDEVRRRKGLPTDKKVVEVSTKQRTRARKV
ncbi:MAG: Ribosomal S5 Elongation factor G III V family [Trebouxia sp. A1-2]|nr:MAG: Ribosomal S5 Elongation factor G III V family [Trebouxia sp. A1-2]